jgi:hypothetical protein
MIYISDDDASIKNKFKECVKILPKLIYLEMFEDDDLKRIKNYSKWNVFYVLRISIFSTININDLLQKIFNKFNFFNIVVLYDCKGIFRQSFQQINCISNITQNVSEKKRIITYLTIIGRKTQPHTLFSNVLSAVLPFIIYFL